MHESFFRYLDCATRVRQHFCKGSYQSIRQCVWFGETSPFGSKWYKDMQRVQDILRCKLCKTFNIIICIIRRFYFYMAKCAHQSWLDLFKLEKLHSIKWIRSSDSFNWMHFLFWILNASQIEISHTRFCLQQFETTTLLDKPARVTISWICFWFASEYLSNSTKMATNTKTAVLSRPSQRLDTRG